jgi:hypothetical protein
MSEQEVTAKEIKKAILAKKKPPQPVEEAELLGVKGWLFDCSSYEFEGWRQYYASKDATMSKLSAAKIVQLCFRDKSGQAVFGDKDIVILGGLPRSEIDPIAKAAMRINGFSEEGAEEIVKNLLTILGADGVYDLLASSGAPCPSCTKDTVPANSPSST